jgi:hypothetical protein
VSCEEEISGSTPTKAVIAAEERGLLEGQRVFRFADDRVTAALAQYGDVKAIALKFIKFDAAGD